MQPSTSSHDLAESGVESHASAAADDERKMALQEIRKEVRRAEERRQNGDRNAEGPAADR